MRVIAELTGVLEVDEFRKKKRGGHLCGEPYFAYGNCDDERSPDVWIRFAGYTRTNCPIGKCSRRLMER